MKQIAWTLALVAAVAVVATPARADDQPTARDIQAAVDSYLGSAQGDAALVGGPGSAGYDAGFWIRGGDFSLRINLTIQARYEWYEWDQVEEPFPGGDLSGFSVPRTTLKLSGTAPCNTRYYVELEFGHFGRDVIDNGNLVDGPGVPNLGGFFFQSFNYDYGREAWIEWGCSDALNFRMGLIKTPNTRQMMTPPELQQFVDISMASALTGLLMPGYTDRNRDHGVMVHGAFGCNGEWSYMLAITNGDGGDSIRPVLDIRTSDNLAYSGRINWAFLQPIGYQEGAVNQSSCQWYGEAGVWAYYYADRIDRPHLAVWDELAVGFDLALGYGGFSFTGAFTWFDFSGSDFGSDFNITTALVQLGYLFPGTPWEIAARWSWYQIDPDNGDGPETNEIAGGVNYYLNGHGNKLQLDFSYIMPDSDFGGGYFDIYAGVPGWIFNQREDSYLVRFQWQLAL